MALVGIAGTWSGTGRLLVSPEMACALSGALFMSTFETVDEEVLDPMGEIANIVVGNMKTMLVLGQPAMFHSVIAMREKARFKAK